LGGRRPTAGVWLSDDAGVSWEQVLRSEETIVAVSCASPRRVYALGENGRLWRSDMGGAVWQAGRSLPVPEAQALCTDPTNQDRLFAACGNAVFVSEDGAATWRQLGRPPFSLPAVVSLALDPERKVLYAGTRGAGVWRIKLAR